MRGFLISAIIESEIMISKNSRRADDVTRNPSNIKNGDIESQITLAGETYHKINGQWYRHYFRESRTLIPTGLTLSAGYRYERVEDGTPTHNAIMRYTD